jgi:3-oxoacyl-[acyl-carrier-protein] synthase-3
MRLEAPGVRVADVETCDFGLMPAWDTESVLRAAQPLEWRRYLTSSVSLKLIGELGVERRHLTHVPGCAPDPARLTAIDLARSAIERIRVRRAAELASLDALIFVSTSNPNPCNSQAALLAADLGLVASCFDLKAGCSGGVLGLMQAALLIRAGCERVLVVMAETLSQLTPVDDLRMLLTVGDGAACVLLERCDGPGFLGMIHGSAPRYARTMQVRESFPPSRGDARYAFEFLETRGASEFLAEEWCALYQENLQATGLVPGDLSQLFLHQTHRQQVDRLGKAFGARRLTRVVEEHGNMGTPTFAVAMARSFHELLPGERFLMQAVGGGISWCSIVAEHG